MYHLPLNYYDKYRENIRKLTGSSIRAASRKYLKPDEFSIVLSGNAAEIEKKLRKFGEVEIVDAEGNRIVE